MAPDSIHSYHRFMWENFFEHINIQRENVHIPRGDMPREQVEEHCREYEATIQRAGGIDYPDSGHRQDRAHRLQRARLRAWSRARAWSRSTRSRGGTRRRTSSARRTCPPRRSRWASPPSWRRREIALIATGEHKAAIIRRAVEGEIDPDVAATYLQQHPNATFYLDAAAAAELTRVKTPWVVGEVKWRPRARDAGRHLAERNVRQVDAASWTTTTTASTTCQLAAGALRLARGRSTARCSTR